MPPCMRGYSRPGGLTCTNSSHGNASERLCTRHSACHRKQTARDCMWPALFAGLQHHQCMEVNVHRLPERFCPAFSWVSRSNWA
mmetsp:Transcript_92282/g.287215  ORF Transcript_92282/g.287215 Transcript_92282/m.287215 type:complete len:84 (+) Transcript_92282:171-422(+)